MCTPVPWLLLLSLQLIVEISSSGTHDSQDSDDEDDSEDGVEDDYHREDDEDGDDVGDVVGEFEEIVAYYSTVILNIKRGRVCRF